MAFKIFPCSLPVWGSISAVHHPGSHTSSQRWTFFCSLLGSPEILWSAGSYKGHFGIKQWWTEIETIWCYRENMKYTYTCISRCVYVNGYLKRRNESSYVAWQEQVKISTPTRWAEGKEWSSSCASSVHWTVQGWLHRDEEATGRGKDRHSPFLPLCREESVQSAIQFLVKKPLLSSCLLRPIRKRTKLYDLQVESVVIITVLAVTAVTWLFCLI